MFIRIFIIYKITSILLFYNILLHMPIVSNVPINQLLSIPFTSGLEVVDNKLYVVSNSSAHQYLMELSNMELL